MLFVSREPLLGVSGQSSGAQINMNDMPTPRALPKTGPAYGGLEDWPGVRKRRGVGISFMLIWAPEPWPETAKQWFPRYEKHFWKEGSLLVGFREWPDAHPDSDRWMVEVDAGPVVAGYGTAASAFGIGATRANGHFEKAYPLSAQALVLSWPLPDGTLLVPGCSRTIPMRPTWANRRCYSV